MRIRAVTAHLTERQSRCLSRPSMRTKIALTLNLFILHLVWPTRPLSTCTGVCSPCSPVPVVTRVTFKSPRLPVARSPRCPSRHCQDCPDRPRSCFPQLSFAFEFPYPPPPAPTPFRLRAGTRAVTVPPAERQSRRLSCSSFKACQDRPDVKPVHFASGQTTRCWNASSSVHGSHASPDPARIPPHAALWAMSRVVKESRSDPTTTLKELSAVFVVVGPSVDLLSDPNASRARVLLQSRRYPQIIVQVALSTLSFVSPGCSLTPRQVLWRTI
ncbi:hypothetical protein OH77DRAFT_98395 [Trametes cingulata]|nr:hypothetical protein OH77DRAFT_98395 [Trametes cingulata]